MTVQRQAQYQHRFRAGYLLELYEHHTFLAFSAAFFMAGCHLRTRALMNQWLTCEGQEVG